MVDDEWAAFGRPNALTGPPVGPRGVEAPQLPRRTKPKEAHMSKHPKTGKNAPKAQTAKRATVRKPAKAARRSATSRKADSLARNGTKQALLVGMLQRSDGATIEQMTAETGWQPHSVRGFLAGTVKKKLGLTVESAVTADRGRVYRIAERG